MKPSKYITKPPPAPRAPRVPPGYSYVAPDYPEPSGLTTPSDIIYQPAKSIDMKMQNYYAAKNRFRREMEFTRQLLRRSYQTSKFADKLIAGRELFQEAMNIRNQVKGLAFPQAMNLARNEREQRAVGAGVQSGLERNDVNAVVREGVPSAQDVTVDDEMLQQGGMEAAKALASMGISQPPGDAEAVKGRLEHFADASQVDEIADEARQTAIELGDAISSAPNVGELDSRVQDLKREAEEYARAGREAGVDTDLAKEAQEQALIDEMTELQAEAADYNEMGQPVPRKIVDRYAYLSRQYEAIFNQVPETLSGQAGRRTRRRGLQGLTEAPLKSPPKGSVTATLSTYDELD